MLHHKFESLNKVKISPLVKKLWVITSVVLFLIVSILFLPWQQTVKGQGTLIAYDPTQRDYIIPASMNGMIEKFYVKENEFVTKGTKLFKIVDLDNNYLDKLKTIEKDSQQKYTNTKIQIKNFQKRKKNLKETIKISLNVYQQKFEQIKNKIKSLQYKKISLEKNYAVIQADLHRIHLLYKDGIESKKSFELRENRYTKADMELKKIVVDINVEKNNVAILENQRRQFLKESENRVRNINISLLQTKNNLQSLNQDIQRDSSRVAQYKSGEVQAEKDGYVVRILQNDKHKLIKQGEGIIYFSPKVNTKSILLKVSNFNMPLIKKGLPVRIMFYGWPALQISGWPKIKFGTFGGIITKVEPTSHENGLYYAQILEDPQEPWPSGNILRIGTQANIWVRLSTVPIWYQLWRLMNAQPPKMLTPTAMEHL